jgi:integrase
MARGAHEGTIGKHKSGLYYARLQVDGKRRTVYAKTRPEVELLLHELKQSIIDGDTMITRDMKFSKLVAAFLESGKQGWSIRTYIGYESLARNHLIPILGDKRVRKLNMLNLQLFINQVSETGASSDLVHHLKRLLSAMFSKGVQWGVVNKNPCDHLTLPRHNQAERPRLTEEDIRRLVVCLKSDRLQGLFILLATTGLRIGEALGLTNSDVDLERHTLTVRKQIQKADSGMLELVDLKTVGSRRTVEIGPTTAKSLRAHQLEITKERLRLGSAWDESWDLMFPNSVGRPLSLSNVRRRHFVPAARLAGLPINTTPNDLRHAFAALSLSKGQDPATVSAMLGHRNISTTLDRYAYAIPGRGRLVADLMDSVVG